MLPPSSGNKTYGYHFS